ncbi:TPA: hypothetical protein ACH3X1_001538 [Trebouxia sp. C0004]
MQPQLMELLHGVHALRPAAVQIHDTHSKDPIRQPAGQVDCSLLASDLRRGQVWFFLSSSSLRTVSFPTALGQLVNCIRRTIVSNLQQQPDRQRAFAVVIPMQSIKVFQFTRLCGSAFNLQRSGAKALSFATDCTGLQEGSSFVYRVDCGEGQAVSKLNRNEREVSSGSERPVEDLGKITMTPLFGAISVLKGFQHSISSHLESLLYELYYLALGSNLADAKVFETFAQCNLWWMTRLGAMVSQSPCHADHIEDSKLRSFMLRLHHVFFQMD